MQDEAALKSWVEAAFTNGAVAVDTETDSLDSMRAHLVGVSLALPGRACYIPLAHKGAPSQGTFDFGEGRKRFGRRARRRYR